MKSKKKSLRASLVCAILDKETLGRRSPFDIATSIKALALPCLIQLRDKVSDKKSILLEASALQNLLRDSNCIFVINDYLDIAKIADTDGVHLGQDDHSLKLTRSILGKNKIIGISCHNLAQAKNAQKSGADYIGVGPVFSTPTKPEYPPIGVSLVRHMCAHLSIPFFAIGGISEDNITHLKSLGINRFAAVRAICRSNNISKTMDNFNQ